MGDPVIAALIGLGGSAIGSLVGVLASARVTQYRLEQLEKQVQKHNSVIDRVYKLESRADVQEEEIKAANRRLDDLERSKKQ